MNKTKPAIRHSFCILHSALCIFAAPAAMIAASAGTIFNVSDVEELTNALINANAANCEIRIAAGTYDLSGVVMSPGESHLQLW